MSYHIPWGRFFLFLHVLCVLLTNIHHTSYGCSVEERAALMELRSSLERANTTAPRSWGRGGDCCSWERVNCSGSGSARRVSHLYLSKLYDISTFPSTYTGRLFWSFNTTVFSAFSELQSLDLSSNSPSTLGSDGIQSTSLFYTYFGISSLEFFENLRNLRELNLSDNQFNGSLPKNLLVLPHLKILDLSQNSLVGVENFRLIPQKCHMIFILSTAFRYLRNIRELYLTSNQFSGELSAFLFSLPHIERLDLSTNLFEGPIPIHVSSNLSLSLKSLRFSQNSLSGKLSFFWLRNLTKLEEIDLSGNTNLAVNVNIPGWVPPFQLKHLALSGCDLDRDIIEEPHFLRTQIHLEELDLSNNNLSGSMPNWLFTKEATLVNLNLGNNSLTGTLAPIGHPQTALQAGIISNNRITGQLPLDFGSVFPCLSTLYLYHNSFYGQIPKSICHINRMRLLDLSNNNFSGVLPPCVFTDFPDLWIFSISNNQLEGLVFGGMNNLSVGFALHLGNNKFEGALPRLLSGRLVIMSLYDNKLSGELDPSFWNLSSLVVLNLSGNRITGNIHPNICNLISIEILDLSDNDFNGPIPRCSSTFLNSLNLSGNSLSGDISQGLFSTPNLMRLDMRYNKLTGNLSWLEDLDNINILSLGWNEFEGQVTPNLCKLCPRIIDLSHNKLSGSLPTCIGRIFSDPKRVEVDNPFLLFTIIMESYIAVEDTRGFTFDTKGNQYTYGFNFFDVMSGIDLCMNMLSGEIPWELGNLSHIKSLNLSNNFFSGQIPVSFANMSDIESLDLSHNELTGSIPWQLTKLWMLESFSVAYNNLSGCIPNSGQFGSFTAESYQGNGNLHSMSQGGGCSSHGSGADDMPVEGSDRIEDDPVLYAVSAASFVLAFWATVAFIVCHPVGRLVILR
ncbi:hypothetical protein HU200_063949 [Digitaria exilis]|uniref:Leucine-rich repeat-containing N-terminal plant-type domain-containing protein n=1 Tax=Digitaria exilis TaxID=1010633 RepID=A0A835A2M8_9POAL|nr:hypothetical protein HU200_063949 [Digitaria exilis]